MAIPEVVTERLFLRPRQVGHAADIFGYAQYELVARSGMWELYESFEQCQRHMERLPTDSDLMWWSLEHVTSRAVGLWRKVGSAVNALGIDDRQSVSGSE